MSRQHMRVLGKRKESDMLLSLWEGCTEEQLRTLVSLRDPTTVDRTIVFVDEILFGGDEPGELTISAVELIMSAYKNETLVYYCGYNAVPYRNAKFKSYKYFDWFVSAWAHQSNVIENKFMSSATPEYKMSCLSRSAQINPFKGLVTSYVFAKDSIVTFGYYDEAVVTECIDEYGNHTELLKNNLKLLNESKLLLPSDSNEYAICAVEKAFVNVVAETLFAVPYGNFSEKTLMSCLVKRPFILVAGPNTLTAMKKLGFKTFDRWWDESYDEEPDPYKRMHKIFDIIDKISEMSYTELSDMLQEMEPILEHNKKMLPNLYEEYYRLLDE